MDEALNSQADGAAPAGTLPTLRGFAVRHSPAGLPGSWVDVMVLPDGRTGVVLGRCADPSAAGRLRSDMREALCRNGDPVESLAGANGAPVSAACAVINATTIAYGTRGDSARVVLVPDGRPTVPRDGALVACDLTPGATVLLSTVPIPGAAALLDSGATLHPDRLADRLVAGCTGSPDGAMVLYRHPPSR